MFSSIRLTNILIRAIAQDAGDRSMKRAGRVKWNEADYNAAVAEYERLSPAPKTAKYA